MRWQQLFDDLQSQFDAQEAAAEQAESASRARVEVGAVRLADRLAVSVRTLRREFPRLPFVLTHVNDDVDAGGIPDAYLPEDFETITF